MNGRAPAVGLMWQLRNPQGRRPLSEVYRDTLAEVEAAEHLGIESAWVSEHHFADDDYLPSVMPALAAMAARTSRVRLGPFVAPASLHHPIRLAEDAAVVDTISGGRLELGLGAGYKADEFDGLGVDRATRGIRTEETVDVLRSAWRDEPLEFRGRVLSFTGMDVRPKPVQRPIPIHLGGVTRPVLSRIARLGVPGVAGIPAASDMEHFLGELAAHGRDPDALTYTMFQYAWIDRDHARARRVGRPQAEWVIDGYRRWLGDVGEASARGTRYEDDVERHCIIGSPDHCVERLRAALDAARHVRVHRLILVPPLLGFDHGESMRTIEAIAQDVVPALAVGPTAVSPTAGR